MSYNTLAIDVSGMFPKSSCVKSLVSSPWCFWEEVGTLKRWESMARSLGHWVHDLEGDGGTPALLPVYFHFLAMR